MRVRFNDTKNDNNLCTDYKIVAVTGFKKKKKILQFPMTV